MDQEEKRTESCREPVKNGESEGETKAALYNLIGMSAGFILMLLLEIFLKGRAGFGYIFLFSVFLAVTGLGRYKLEGSKAMLLGTICWTISSVIWLILYLVRG